MKYTYVIKFSDDRRILPITSYVGESATDFIKRAELMAERNLYKVLDLEIIELDDAHREHLLQVMECLNAEDLAGDYIIIVIYYDKPRGHKKTPNSN